MIISHKHRFIFIKTEKTAGTSLEIALSKFCGPNDIITPISEEDEIHRKKLGYRTFQNCKIPYSKYSKSDLLRRIFKNKTLEFYNHAPAKFIKRYIGEDIWNAYYKFCFERNPFDKVLSWYYYLNKDNTQNKPSITEFIHSFRANIIRGFELYTINSEIVVDKVYLYEEIDEAVREITEILNLPDKLILPKAKAGYRKTAKHYRDILSDKDRDRIKKVYAREMEFFNYSF